jgi:hypothetical protein
MPFEQHQERSYPSDPARVYAAVLKANEALEGKIVASSPEQGRLEVKLPKVMLGKTLGERTQLTCQVTALGSSSGVVVDAYPLDALERKLLFGARKGVTETAVTWFLEQMEKNL